MRVVRGLFSVPVTMVMACGSLSACYIGPDPVQYGALAVVDGKPTAVVALCGRSTTRLSVFQDDENPADHEFRSWAATVTVPAPAPDVTVELLAADEAGVQVTGPAGTAVPQASGLRSFEPGHRYVLNASSGGPEGTRAPTVSFTTDDFSRIGEGQVLAPVDYEHSAVVSRESFVEEACAKKGPGAE